MLSDFSRHSLQQHYSPSTQSDDLLTDEDNMPIQVYDAFHSWFKRNNLQGFLKVAEAKPHPRAEAQMKEIDVSKITNKKFEKR